MNSSTKIALLTGSTGFLGTYIKSELDKKGYKTITLGRKKTDIIHDLSEGAPKITGHFDYLIHCAGKAHVVPKTEKEADLFYSTNFMGTLNLLDGINQNGSNIKCIVFVSSVAVYGVNEGVNINETFPLLATDPYGKSKISTEKAIEDYCNANNVKCCILRLPLIAGDNPPGNLGSMIRAIKKGWYLSIGNADARKSIVLAKDVASLIPNLFEKSGIYNLTDGYNPTFRELELAIALYLNKRVPLIIPQFMANFMAKTGDFLGKGSPFNSIKLRKIQSTLTFLDEKARKELSWKPHSVIDYYLSMSKFQVPNFKFQEKE